MLHEGVKAGDAAATAYAGKEFAIHVDDPPHGVLIAI